VDDLVAEVAESLVPVKLPYRVLRVGVLQLAVCFGDHPVLSPAEVHAVPKVWASDSELKLRCIKTVLVEDHPGT